MLAASAARSLSCRLSSLQARLPCHQGKLSPAATGTASRPSSIVCDHRNVTAMISQCLEASRDGDKELAASLADAVTVDVLLYSRAEEAVLYPFMAKHLGEEGRHLSEHSDHEHAQLEGKLLAALLAARQGDAAALQREMEGAQKAFEHHMHDEEDKYLPKLAQAVQQEELRELTAHWAKAKQNARLEQLSGSEHATEQR